MKTPGSFKPRTQSIDIIIVMKTEEKKGAKKEGSKHNL